MSASAQPTSSKARVYLVEDEEDLREALAYSLGQMNFEVAAFADAAAFYRAFAVAPCDVVVLDVNLPGEDGFSIASHLRSASDVGIVLATARGTLPDRVHGIKSGADAYLVKPLHPEELAATLEAVIRRLRRGLAAAASAQVPSPYQGGNWALSEGNWVVSDPMGRRIRLTTSERAIMTRLLEAPGTPVDREELVRALGGDPLEFDLQRIDAIVSRLRRKASAAGMTLPLHSVRGTGYEFHR